MEGNCPEPRLIPQHCQNSLGLSWLWKERLAGLSTVSEPSASGTSLYSWPGCALRFYFSAHGCDPGFLLDSSTEPLPVYLAPTPLRPLHVPICPHCPDENCSLGKSSSWNWRASGGKKKKHGRVGGHLLGSASDPSPAPLSTSSTPHPSSTSSKSWEPSRGPSRSPLLS